MADFPNPRTRRYSIIKFIYTADNDDRFIRTQRQDKDTAGNPFLDLPSCVTQVQNRSKDKIWGDPSNLRKVIIKYDEPNNQTGEAQITQYIPDTPTAGTKECIKQVFSIAETKFTAVDRGYCIEYIGENRYGIEQPRRIEF